MISYFRLFQAILSDFVNVELLFHAKALEMLTQCYNSLESMDEEQDLEVRSPPLISATYSYPPTYLSRHP